MKIIKLLFLKYKKYELFFIISLLIVFSSILVWPLLRNGLPPTHDGEYHVVRAYQFDKTLRDGDLYPRWLPDLNYGYGTPLLNYYYPLPYYAMSFLHFFGTSFIDSFKISIFIATIIGAVFFFLWARIFWGNTGGFISSLFYTFSPYHIVEMYIRGAVGEVWALAFFPAFLWSITKAIKEKKQIFFSVAAIFFAMIIFSHNILALMFFPFAFSYLVFMVISNKQKSFVIRHSLYSLFLGLGIAAVFWLPALLESSYVEGLQIYNIKDNFPEIFQLLIPSWGSGFSGSGLRGQMSFQIGLVNLGAVFLSVISIIFFHRRKNNRLAITAFFLSWFILILFLLQKVSLLIWESVPLMNYFQFPWRFLALEILIASFLGGCIVLFFKGKMGKVLISIACISSVGLSVGYINPAYYLMREDSYYFTRPNFMDGTNTPGNFFNTIWFNKNINERKQDEFEIISGKGAVAKIDIKATHYKFVLYAEDEITIRVNTAYFPGWKVVIDGNKQDVGRDEEGLILITAPRGNHKVDVVLNNTTTRNIATFVTFLSLFLMISYSLFRRVIIIK